MARRVYVVRVAVVASLVATVGLTATAWAPPEVAPPPREVKPKPKSRAELLVGKWRQVKQSDRQEVLKGVEITIEFTAKDGVTILVVDGSGRRPLQRGKYTFDGDRIDLTMKDNGDIESREFAVRIDELTADKLIYTELGPEALNVEFERIVGKDR